MRGRRRTKRRRQRKVPPVDVIRVDTARRTSVACGTFVPSFNKSLYLSLDRPDEEAKEYKADGEVLEGKVVSYRRVLQARQHAAYYDRP